MIFDDLLLLLKKIKKIVVDNMIYMDTVNTSGHVLICVVDNNKQAGNGV